MCIKQNPGVWFLVLILFFSIGLSGQETSHAEIELPFIDRDGDGINDLLQNGWGLRFVDRYKKRQLVWEQLNVEIIRGDKGREGREGLLVDTDGDGVGDMDMHEYMKGKMDTLIDTDGDGTPDMALKDYLGRQFRAFDRNGDGLPDDISPEEMREKMKQMEQWRREMRDRVREGQPPFEDANGDGVPDQLPPGFGWRGQPGSGHGGGGR